MLHRNSPLPTFHLFTPFVPATLASPRDTRSDATAPKGHPRSVVTPGQATLSAMLTGGHAFARVARRAPVRRGDSDEVQGEVSEPPPAGERAKSRPCPAQWDATLPHPKFILSSPRSKLSVRLTRVHGPGDNGQLGAIVAATRGSAHLGCELVADKRSSRNCASASVE
jgi:hypothetical protein